MELKNITSQMFEPEIFNDMCEWYLDTTSGEWKYVVFVVRRSYILAQILEKITQKYMAKVAGTIYLTDAAFCCAVMLLRSTIGRMGVFQKFYYVMIFLYMEEISIIFWKA